MNKRQTKQLSHGYFFIIVIAYIAALFGVSQQHQFHIEQQKQAISHEVNLTFHYSLRAHETLARYIYAQSFKDKDVLTILASTQTATADDLVVLRSELSKYLTQIFELHNSIAFSHIQFRLPNNEVFLRFDRDVGLSHVANDTISMLRQYPHHRKVSHGFHIDEQEVSYRFAYPLYDDAIFIGSVEFMLPIDSLFADMGLLLSTTQLAFVLRDDVLLSWENQNEAVSFACDVATDKQLLFHSVSATPSTHSLLSLPIFQAEACAQIALTPEKLQPFTVIFTTSNGRQVVDFDVIAAQNENIGFIIAATNSTAINAIYNESMQLRLVATILMVTLIILLVTIRLQRQFIARHALFDPLTEIYNRTIFADFAQKFIIRQERDKSSISVAVIDIDAFKQINDRFGHQVGDKVLIEVVNVVSSLIRKSDLFARFGGYEFVILFPDTNIIVAKAVLERVLRHVEKSKFTKVENVSLSIGVHEKRVDETLEEAINCADTALYQAKNLGKNQIVESKLSNLG